MNPIDPKRRSINRFADAFNGPISTVTPAQIRDYVFSPAEMTALLQTATSEPVRTG